LLNVQVFWPARAELLKAVKQPQSSIFHKFEI